MIFRKSSHKNQNLDPVEDTSTMTEKLEKLFNMYELKVGLHLMTIFKTYLQKTKWLMIYKTYMIFLESPFTKDTTRF